MFTIQIINITMGKIESIQGNIVKIKSDTWSPGLWCGCEGATMKVDNFKFIVNSINLKYKYIHTNEVLDQSLVGKDIRFGSEIK